MKNKKHKQYKRAINILQNPVNPNRPFISPMVDPNGSWTGTSYVNPKEIPPQDVDDL